MEERRSGPHHPGLKFDGGKLRFDLVPPVAERQLAAVLTFGALKYEENSWQEVSEGRKRYFAALRRHLDDYWDGRAIDEDSGLHHLTHAFACLAFLLWLEDQDGNVPDPRDSSLQERWAGIREAYAKKRLDALNVAAATGDSKQLEAEIRRHRDLYYNQQPEISDEEFDTLVEEFKKRKD